MWNLTRYYNDHGRDVIPLLLETWPCVTLCSGDCSQIGISKLTVVDD